MTPTLETHVDKAAAWDELAKKNAEINRLSRQLAEAREELRLWRASFPGSAEAVKRDALSNMRGMSEP